MDHPATPPPYQGPAWLQNAVIYQVYPQSFQDSNGDGIGDLPGLISRLDHIKSLGADAIWLNPVFDSPFSDAGYDVRDYVKIAPRYGTNDDAQRLFHEAHRRGLRVIFDLVAGHTSIEHPWFVESAKAERNPYTDRYIWADEATPPPGNFVVSHGGRKGSFLKNFFATQPALNYGYLNPDPARPWEMPVDHPAASETLSEMLRIMKLWMDLGCDGFRVDMAASLVKNDPDYQRTYALWMGVRIWMEHNYPDNVLIAEWGDPTAAIKAGFHIDFMLHFGVPGYPSLFFNEVGTFHHPACFFDARGLGSTADFLTNYLQQSDATRGRGYIAIPSANHDFQRPNCGARDASQLRVVWAFLLTWPGVPFIYYGDEIGMRFLEDMPDKEGGLLDPHWGGGNRAGSRTPMQWDNAAANAGFSTAPPHDLYLPIDPSPERPCVTSQETDVDSLLNFIRRLVAFRKAHPALGNCLPVTPLATGDGGYPFVYQRQDSNERFVIALNPSARPAQATFPLPGVASLKPVFADKTQATIENGHAIIRMQGVSFGIFSLAPA